MNDAIIVGVTDAAVSERAIDWAVRRAVDRGGRIELLSVVGGAIGAVGEDAVVSDALRAAEAMLEDRVRDITADGIEVTTRTEAGNPVAALIEASRYASLLVIGSDYRGPGTGHARGAHGVRIAAGAHCPVVVVPDVDAGADRNGVIVGVDGSPVSEHALRFAAAEADRLREKLIAVSVWTPVVAPRNDFAVYPDLYLENMQAATEEVLALALAGIASDYPDLTVERVVEQGYPSQVINTHAENARLAVVGTHGRGAIARFLLGSISQEVLARLATVTAVVR
ncbi:MAG: universal stress protein [Microbacterium sp.]|uniref:universal stress protein n=1 Tax=Microbacterium sp. TaxID=51671 RepID=UPI001AD0BB37|nr:universal stress protein [Microbacterium sp.]MBN9177559.1 universal stress protein [Microbacterium sp.]